MILSRRALAGLAALALLTLSTPTLAQTPAVDALKESTFNPATQDNDGNGTINPGDNLSYTITVTNTGLVDAVDVVLDDVLDPELDLVVGSVTTTQGTVVSGNGPGDAAVQVDLGTLMGGGSAVITFEVLLAIPFPEFVSIVANQGTVSGGNFATLVTDDPSTTADDDITLTPIDPTFPAPPDTAAIPTLSEWMLLLLAVGIGGAAVLRLGTRGV